MAKYFCIKDGCHKSCFYAPTPKYVNLVKYELYNIFKMPEHYNIYDKNKKFLTCLLPETTHEHFIEIAEYRNKQIEEIFKDD